MALSTVSKALRSPLGGGAAAGGLRSSLVVSCNLASVTGPRGALGTSCASGVGAATTGYDRRSRELAGHANSPAV
jgi:hypothetical protein